MKEGPLNFYPYTKQVDLAIEPYVFCVIQELTEHEDAISPLKYNQMELNKMSEATETPVVENPALKSNPTDVASEPTKASPAKVSPAQDLRDIQYLLLNGIFPGNVAPAVVKAYQLLENMAKTVEASVESK